MPRRDPRVDAYIAKSADFAKPILNRIRNLIHAECPDVTETLKWNSPFFEHNGILIGMPAFKRHCALIFWKGKLLFSNEQRKKFRRITSVADLPGDKILAGHIRKAAELNEAGIPAPRPRPKPRKEVAVPEYLLAALKKNRKAMAEFGNSSPSHKREYVLWITDAKREETRMRRVQTAIAQLADGKSQNWKYQKQPRAGGLK